MTDKGVIEPFKSDGKDKRHPHPNLNSRSFIFFSLPGGRELEGGGVFEGKKILSEFTLTLTLSRQGRGKKQELREREGIERN